MNVLAIGNSFSQDATRYLHQIARADGTELNVCNLHIGGCPLDRHFRNMHSEAKAYFLEFNGQQTKFMVSLKEALLSRSWDIVTLQQSSPISFLKETYFPYITALADYIKQLCPKAKIVIHQTWGFGNGSEKLESTGFATYHDMVAQIASTYAEVAEEMQADGIIPSGQMFGYLLAHGVEKIHRDTLHTTKGLGRYSLGLLWYHMLCGASVANNSFCDFDEPIAEEHVKLAKDYVDSLTPLF